MDTLVFMLNVCKIVTKYYNNNNITEYYDKYFNICEIPKFFWISLRTIFKKSYTVLRGCITCFIAECIIQYCGDHKLPAPALRH